MMINKNKGSAIRTMPQFFSVLCPNSYSYYALTFFMITGNTRGKAVLFLDGWKE